MYSLFSILLNGCSAKTRELQLTTTQILTILKNILSPLGPLKVARTIQHKIIIRIEIILGLCSYHERTMEFEQVAKKRRMIREFDPDKQIVVA